MATEGQSVVVASPVEFDRIADALGHGARRQVLVGLLDHNPLDYREAIAGDVATDPDGANVRMVHNHLPKLDEMGYVSWDSDTGTVVKGARWDEIEPTLQLLSDNTDRLPGDVF